MVSALLWLSGLVAVSGVLSGLYASGRLWSIAVVLWLGALSLWSGAPAWLLWTLWIAATAVLLAINVRPLRRSLISARLLPWFRRSLPRLSRTEQEALDAGTVGWDRELFSGRPDWRRLRELPPPRLTAEEQAFLEGPVEALCAMLDDWRISDELHDLPPEVWRFLKEHGFFGMVIPKRYGGLGFSALAHSAVVMKVASRSFATGVVVMVPSSLGPGKLLLHFGTEEQRSHYLPRLARGEEIPCFALTSPEAGSDAASMTDSGVVCREDFAGRRDVLGIRLNWQKRYITLAPVATVIGLAFKLYDPQHLLGDTEDVGITLALVPVDTPGVRVGRRHRPMDQAFPNGPLAGKDVFIPLDWIIGGQSRAGQGWRMVVECLAEGRSISLPALATGACKLASRIGGAYAGVRRQFRQPIGRFEGVQEALARMAGHTYMAAAARSVTLAALDAGERPAVISAIVKYELTERMRKVVADAMDVQAGAAICNGPRNLLARMYMTVPIGITVEGANILTRCMIVFGQGAIRSHPYVLHEIVAARDPDAARGLRSFDELLFAHLGQSIGNLMRCLFHGVTGERSLRVPGTQDTRRYYRSITRMSAAFAVVADAALLTLGGELKRREQLSGRLADVLAQLYLISAALKHFEDQGALPEDLPLLDWGCQDALYRLQEGLYGLFANLPNRALAALLRTVTFPLGRSYRAPSDRLGQAAAAVLLAPSAARDRLTEGIYYPPGPDDALPRLEDALAHASAVEPVEQRLRERLRAGELQGGIEEAAVQALAAGLLGEQEAALVRTAAESRQAALRVDEFGEWRKEPSPWRQEPGQVADRSW
jgi:acyl-CoA dehydrogenase